MAADSQQEHHGRQRPKGPDPKSVGYPGNFPGCGKIAELIINHGTAIYRLVGIDTEESSKRRDDGK